MAKKINNKRIIKVQFEDQGQDFLIWHIEWDCDFDMGFVTDCEPFQASVWVGTGIFSYPVVGEHLVFKTKHSNLNESPLVLRYPVIAISEVTNNDK